MCVIPFYPKLLHVIQEYNNVFSLYDKHGIALAEHEIYIFDIVKRINPVKVL